ncbi:MAG: enoyl-CoA hydratase/isomerase family protein [Burkholderiales bacterium]|nr:enoyl-CoA hydratase/isomerase family protein [Burkholderiales bacterium]
MLKLEVADRVARLTLDRPPVNAISSDWLAAFQRVLDGLRDRDDWQVLHLRSSQKVFCAGADLAEMRERFTREDGVEAMTQAAAAMQGLFARIEALPQVSLAEIGGAALGGGFELALACDLRIAAAEAKLGLPEARLGLVPGAGGTQRLTRIAGRAAASRLILGAEIAGGAAAAAMGLAQWALPLGEIAHFAARKAAEIAALPAGALAACKACIAAAHDPARDGYAAEIEASRRLYADAQTRERVRAFLERPAQPGPQTKE